jgi:hypothetical protein
MARPSTRPLAVLLCGLVLSACQLAAAPNTQAGQLPTYDPGDFCSLAALLPLAVHVDPRFDPPTWIEGADGGHALKVEWPSGFSLRTTDGVAEVVDPDGNVVVRDGGQLTDAGGGASARGDGWFSVCILGGGPST